MSIVSVVELNCEPDWGVLHGSLNHRVHKRDLVFLDARDDFGAHAAGCNADEIPCRVAPVVIDVRHPPDVDTNAAAGTKNFRRITTAGWNLERATKILRTG